MRRRVRVENDQSGLNVEHSTLNIQRPTSNGNPPLTPPRRGNSTFDLRLCFVLFIRGWLSGPPSPRPSPTGEGGAGDASSSSHPIRVYSCSFVVGPPSPRPSPPGEGGARGASSP